MTDLSYQMIRSANQAREAEDQRAESRKRNLLLLVNHYLNEEGYIETATALSKETNLDFSKFEVCDNVDLITVLLEYESYHFVKFQRYPKIAKPVTANPSEPKAGRQKLKGHSSLKSQQSGGGGLPRIASTGGVQQQQQQASGKKPAAVLSPQQQQMTSGSKPQQQLTPAAAGNGLLPAPAAQSAFEDENAGLSGLVIRGQTDPASPGVKQKRRAGQIIDFRGMINAETRLTVEEGQSGQQFHDPADRLLKPLGGFLGYNQEWRDLASTISRDIFLHNPNVRWQDIIGLESAKRLVKEAVVYPIKYPQLFTGILSPWKGLLLYGPPGTGKTLLAKAVATECNTTFFNISASSIVSKWRGDSEKLVRVLFEMARFHAPSTIFLDELDSLMSQRAGAGGGGEHEGSRRMKTELLVQMDGLAKTDELVFLLAASNLPWELDHAMLRRLEKRILVDLPNHEARQKMMEQHLPPISRQPDGGLELRCDVDYERAAALTEGYSGSDITLVCKEAAMRVVRKIFDALENHTEGGELNVKLDPLTTRDVELALETTKPSAKTLAGKYKAWQRDYESV
ncbi:hypothetical protein BOX15_Mlig001163g3 [Macrostomum lignano]|uniref:Katanin p60 ATPase-containing subunit A-like 2 n=1 Tax=Macrostomum lignano TaxID=282301 RepID=A0A267GVS5_9PLAT|nr:hypothetical protein BOX15_Mlig001163g10 [Macrostomum lignano]PAA89564.1 hypothetical protein BOX15_Mlig001163g3 [Macrostomum lignano]